MNLYTRFQRHFIWTMSVTKRKGSKSFSEASVFVFETNKFNMKCKSTVSYRYLYLFVGKDGTCEQVKAMVGKMHEGFSIETVELMERWPKEVTEENENLGHTHRHTYKKIFPRK